MPLVALLALTSVARETQPWKSWIANLGHDVYTYPSWLDAELQACECTVRSASSIECAETTAAGALLPVSWRAAIAADRSARAKGTPPPSLSYCVARTCRRSETRTDPSLPPERETPAAVSDLVSEG